jgi:heptosyltransferase-1
MPSGPPTVRRILLIKTSSLGDVIHNLPVVSDLRARFPEARIDWVVEEAFADIPRLHPGVATVLPVAWRRWRRQLLQPATWRAMADFRRRLQAETYDAVLDTQGLVKSAVLARLARGPRFGHAAASAREALAARAYDAGFLVPHALHAVDRNRRLAAAAFGYTPAPRLDYGIAARPPSPRGRSVVLLTASSRDDKLWPEINWVNLGRALARRGLTPLLPGGNARERERARRIAADIPGAQAVPPMPLVELAHMLAHAAAAVGVDTGLSHLAAALETPTLALYTATDPARTGVLGTAWHRNLGGPDQTPSVQEALTALWPILPPAPG